VRSRSILNGACQSILDYPKVHDELIEKMRPGAMYYPSDLYFPGAEFAFAEDDQNHKKRVKGDQNHKKRKQAFCIQVTFSKKAISLQERLGMDPQHDKLFVYLVTQPR